MIQLPNLGLTAWNLLTDPYDYTQLVDNWARIDEHDHSSGKGIQINGATGIVDGTITSTKFAPGAFTLADSSVTTAKLVDGSISTAKIINGNVTADKLADAARLGLTDSSSVRRLYLSTPASQSTSSTTYATLATSDSIPNLVFPNGGMLRIGFQAKWSSTVSAAGSAAIFLGANQIKIQGSGGPVVQEVATTGTGSNSLWTSSTGLNSAVSSGADVTTGQILGYGGTSGGMTNIFAAAGTYTLSVQYKASSGSVSAQNRQLWGWAIAF